MDADDIINYYKIDVEAIGIGDFRQATV